MRHKRTVVIMALVLMGALTILSAEAEERFLMANATNCRGSFPSDDEKLQVSKGRLTTVFGAGTASVTCSLPYTRRGESILERLNPQRLKVRYQDYGSLSADISVRFDFYSMEGGLYSSPSYILTDAPPGGETYHYPASQPGVCLLTGGPYKLLIASGPIVNDGEPLETIVSVNATYRLREGTYILNHELVFTTD
jgi:hypothetical protein